MIKRPTHTWLKPVLDQLDGVFATGLGSASSLHGLYGQAGVAQLASGTAGITGWTGAGSSTVSNIWFNGGTGAFYNLSDVVTALKNVGILKR